MSIEAETQTPKNEDNSKQKETSQQKIDVKEPTPQEIAEYQAKQMAYMKGQLPFLKVQAEYTLLMATIDENHVRRLEANMRYAKYGASQNSPAKTATPNPDGKKEDIKA